MKHMKKVLSMVLLLVMLLCLSACGQTPAPSTDATTEPSQTTAATEATEPTATEPVVQPADPFAGINELEPNEKGVYQIYSIEGLRNMAKHPDAQFELLCSIDMGGEVWEPVGTQSAPFSGKLNGQYFTISNFKIEKPTADGDMGFFGVNTGNIVNLYMTDGTVTATADTLRVGLLVGDNRGNIRRNDIAGTVSVAQAAEGVACGGAVGINTKILETTVARVDILCTTTGSATVGGLVGIQEGGKLQYSSARGKLEVTGGDNKTVGMLAGKASELDLVDTGFTGSVRTVDGKVLTDCLGVSSNVTNTGWYVSDMMEPLSAELQARRDKVVQVVRQMATVKWTVSEPLNLYADCTCCKTITYLPGEEYRGIPYTHKNGSMQRFEFCLTEDNVMEDWIYDMQYFDGWDVYVGNDCSSAMQQAYATVCNDCEFMRSKYQFPIYGNGTIAVGGWEWNLPKSAISNSTEPYITATGIEKMLECYAQIRYGDLIGNVVPAGGHCQMVVQDPVVVRDETGKINPDESYVVTIQQIASQGEFEEGYSSTWRVDKEYTFQQLLDLFYVPMTFAELIDEDAALTPEATIVDGTDGRLGLTTGVVTSNLYLDSVEMVITDAAGNEVFSRRMFVTADKSNDSGSENRTIRRLPREYDLAYFATALRMVEWDTSASYHCVITAHLTCGEAIVVKDYTF